VGRSGTGFAGAGGGAFFRSGFGAGGIFGIEGLISLFEKIFID
jgi:hypothetical protein